MPKRMLSLTIVVILLLMPALAFAAGFSADPDAIGRAAKSVLMLEVYDADGELLATGSGFVAFNNRTLVTNYHVIEDAAWMIANSDDGDQYQVSKLLIADADKDIAICEFARPTDLAPLTLNIDGELKRAQNVVAIGNPLGTIVGTTNTVSIGNISALYRDDVEQWIQFTAPISSGSSGGALFDDQGRVIGMTSAYLIDAQNMNLAIHISEVTDLYAQASEAAAPFEEYGMVGSIESAEQFESKYVVEWNGMYYLFPAVQGTVSRDRILQILESEYGLDTEVPDSDAAISVYGDDVRYLGGKVDFCNVDMPDDWYEDTVYYYDTTDFITVRSALLEEVGAPDFGVVELWEDGFEAWNSDGEGRHEVRRLTRSEQCDDEIATIVANSELSDAKDYIIRLLWNNMMLACYVEDAGTNDAWINAYLTAGYIEITEDMYPEEAPEPQTEMESEQLALQYNYNDVGYDLKRGDEGSEVRNIQNMLIDLGYLNDRADGVFGVNTKAAIEAFQRNNGIHGDANAYGVATTMTQAVLFSDVARSADQSPQLRRWTIEGNPYNVKNDDEIITEDGAMVLRFRLENLNPTQPVMALAMRWWLLDEDDDIIYNGTNGWTVMQSCMFNNKSFAGAGEIETITWEIPEEFDLDRASKLRWWIAELVYENGEVYMNYDASASPDYSIAAYTTDLY